MFAFKKRSLTHQAAYEGVLGTSLELLISATGQSAGREAEDRILGEIDRLEAVFSTYRPDSEFMRWQETRDERVSVSRDLATVLLEAERWRAESGGAFLPVVEALTQAWQRGDTCSIPIDPGMPMWEVDLHNMRATRRTAYPASLDAIAKGYIVDRAVEAALEVPTLESVLVNIGGDLRCHGKRSTTISITDPAKPFDNSAPLCKIRISNAAVATSGGYRRGFTIDGERYSHIFDPTRGKPIEMLRSASVLAPNAMLADVFATIVGVLPPNEGLAFADRFDSIGILVVDEAGNCHQNSVWSRSIVPPRKSR